MPRPQTSHPLDPLSPAEISVAVATVRAAGPTPEVNHTLLPFKNTLLRITSSHDWCHEFFHFRFCFEIYN